MSELLQICRTLHAEAKRRDALGRGGGPESQRFRMIGPKPNTEIMVDFNSQYAFASGANCYGLELRNHARGYPLVIVYPDGKIQEERGGTEKEMLESLRTMALLPRRFVLYGEYSNGKLVGILHAFFSKEVQYIHHPGILYAVCPSHQRQPLVSAEWFQAKAFWKLVDQGIFRKINKEVLNGPYPLEYGVSANGRGLYRYRGVIFKDSATRGSVTFSVEDCRPGIRQEQEQRI